MAAGNSITGVAILGSTDSHSLSGQASLGAYDSHSMGGEASLGAFDCHSLSGEASYGAFDSHSTTGEASVSGVPITIPGLTTSGGLQLGFFLKIGYTGFSNNIALVQFGLPSSGYIHVALNTSPALISGIGAAGNGGTWSLASSATGTLTINTWYYVTLCYGVSGGNVVQRMYVYQNGIAGFYDQGQVNAGAAVSTDTNLTAVFGLGMVTSSNTAFTTYQNFPSLAGWEISKFWLRNANPVGAAFGGPNLLPLPTTDSAISSMSPPPLIFYNCRQTAGTISTLTDNSGNGYNATAGSLGLQVLTDGPYA